MGVKKNFFLCFILSPIGAIYIVMNRGGLQKRDFILYLLFAAINICWLSLMIFDWSVWMVAGSREQKMWFICATDTD
ncbi:hypothetical protein COK59_17610 [Bacillus thuringiensis]|nr:hypothetical protein CON29_18600 [Bacillus thuringiensis]PEY68600.1 hypothetical protein CN352_06110 [Bacillus thuringiensis]PFA06407.1 hypothetical protein CN379_15165 [Bacillus thuringiensis]PFF01371.1 hypothetical protein CN325_03770 [Bacillus thuringiensis]PFM22969.1 hypothetical protein COJ41_14860 [Bacillus thuringiensis]